MARHRLCEVLTPRALAAWAGTDRLSALPYRLPSGPHETEAARLFALLVGGDEIALPSHVETPVEETSTYTILEALTDLGLVEVDSKARANVSVLPLGASLLVCDRLDASGGTNLVCWPDDSSYHLARSIPPGRHERWLDIATGSAFAPLLRPEVADEIIGAEINPRAVQYARLGLQLSGLDGRAQVVEADLTAGIEGAFELVTCNAPIPAAIGPLWRATADPTFFERLFEQVPGVLAPDGMFVLHAELAPIERLVEKLPGERVTVSYVPEGGRQFGILWWRPDGESRQVVTRRELTEAAPHLTHADRTAALP
jgi:hypothetical protein